MRHIRFPEQNMLFDYYQTVLSPAAYNRLTSGYHAVFRFVILSILPAKEIAENFHPIVGRPTKELYSMAGLLLLKEFHDWTTEETVDAYMFDTRVQYALNLGRDNISLSTRTLERYMKLMQDDELSVKIFDDVTVKLIDELGIKIDQQRLDSTHVFSDMATFSRTKLMGVTIKRFLVQLKRHDKDTYEALPAELRARYEKRANALFADVSRDKGKRTTLRQDVAEQMHDLIQHFSGNENVENMTTFKQLLTLFSQQCEVIDCIEINNVDSDENNDDDESPTSKKNESGETQSSDKSENPKCEVKVRKKTGGDVIQNPSDPDATYCGHKGPGYQIQIAETSNAENEVQLVTAVLPQTAVESDANAVVPILQNLEKSNHLPREMTADSLYGSDDNVVAAAHKQVEIVSPVAGVAPKEEPERPTEKQVRLQKRREHQDTEKWRKTYNSRAQIEGTIGSIKRRTGMVRLRYRGRKRMFSSMYLKLAGWNISRAVCSARIQAKIAKIVKRGAITLKQSFRWLRFVIKSCSNVISVAV